MMNNGLDYVAYNAQCMEAFRENEPIRKFTWRRSTFLFGIDN